MSEQDFDNLDETTGGSQPVAQIPDADSVSSEEQPTPLEETPEVPVGESVPVPSTEQAALEMEAEGAPPVDLSASAGKPGRLDAASRSEPIEAMRLPRA